MHAERTLRLAHLSDLHLPLLFRGRWDARWRRLAAALRAEAPDAVVVTGDLVNSGFPAARLERALREMERLLSGGAPGAELVIVPGNHDLKLLGLGPSQGDARAAVERVFGARALVGAGRVLRGLVHLVGADSNAASFLAQGRIDGAIAIPGRCDAPHVHVLLLHHHLHPEPPRAGENAVTSSHMGLRLVDAPEARRAILAAGFQLVLHGHRHLTTAYREAEVDGFSDPVHFVGAPSGTDRAWPGFNLVDFFDDHTFRVAAVERTQDAWRPPYTLAVRPYEAVKAGRRAAARRAMRFEADLAEVEVWTGDRGTGDVRFRIALEGVVAHERAVPFPARIVPYAGAYLRGVSARWSRAGAASDLQVDGSGRFLLDRIPEPSAIEVTGTIANALPAAPGDWCGCRPPTRASRTSSPCSSPAWRACCGSGCACPSRRSPSSRSRSAARRSGPSTRSWLTLSRSATTTPARRARSSSGPTPASPTPSRRTARSSAWTIARSPTSRVRRASAPRPC
ncbi:MAG: metallophosphoesterase family protein, partial [Anaeromyxobacteraceae bacterium]